MGKKESIKEKHTQKSPCMQPTIKKMVLKMLMLIINDEGMTPSQTHIPWQEELKMLLQLSNQY
jgi:hypothetical protein